MPIKFHNAPRGVVSDIGVDYITLTCPSCEEVIEENFAWNIVVNEMYDYEMDCDYCDHKWLLPMRINISIDVGKEKDMAPKEKIMRETLERIASSRVRVDGDNYLRETIDAKFALAECDQMPDQVCGTCVKWNGWGELLEGMHTKQELREDGATCEDNSDTCMREKDFCSRWEEE